MAQTPARALGATPKVANYVNAHTFSIKAGTHVVPLTYPTAADPFRGGGAVYGLFSFWDDSGGVPIPDREARHRFSLSTCNGCHTGETYTTFTHIGAEPFGTTASLSAFMTGTWVNDPADWHAGALLRRARTARRRPRRPAQYVLLRRAAGSAAVGRLALTAQLTRRRPAPDVQPQRRASALDGVDALSGVNTYSC